MSAAKSVIRNTVFEMSSQVIGNILSYFLIIIIARYLGDIGLGQYSFVFAFIGIAAAFLDLGVGSYFIIYVSKNKKAIEKYFHNFMAIRLITAIICLLIPIIGSFFIHKDYTVILSIWLGAFAIFFMNIGNAMRYVFIIFERFEYNSLITIIERILAFGIGLFLLLKYKSLPIFIIALLISYFSTMVLAFIFLKKFTTFRIKFDLVFWKHLFVMGFPFFLIALASIIIQRMDTILLSLLAGDSVTGWYNAAYRLIDIVNLVPVALSAVILPVLSRLYVENKEAMQLLLKKTVKYSIILAMPLAAGTILLADRVILFVYKEQFTNSILALQLLIFMEAIVFINLILGQALSSVLQQKKFLIAIMYGAIVSIVLNIILIPKYGLVGSGIAIIAAQLIMFFMLYYYISKEITQIPFLSYLWQPAIATLALALAILKLSWLPLWWLTLICIITYFAAIFILGGIDKSDIALATEMIATTGKLSIARVIGLLKRETRKSKAEKLLKKIKK